MTGGSLDFRCPACGEPTRVKEDRLPLRPGDEPTGETRTLLGREIPVRRAVIIECTDPGEGDCNWAVEVMEVPRS